MKYCIFLSENWNLNCFNQVLGQDRKQVTLNLILKVIFALKLFCDLNDFWTAWCFFFKYDTRILSSKISDKFEIWWPWFGSSRSNLRKYTISCERYNFWSIAYFFLKIETWIALTKFSDKFENLWPWSGSPRSNLWKCTISSERYNFRSIAYYFWKI